MSWKYFILFVSIHGVRWCVSTLSFSHLFMEVLWWFCNPADSTYGAPDEVVFLSISQKIWCCFFQKNIRPVPQVHLILPQIKYHNFFEWLYIFKWTSQHRTARTARFTSFIREEVPHSRPTRLAWAIVGWFCFELCELRCRYYRYLQI